MPTIKKRPFQEIEGVNRLFSTLYNRPVTMRKLPIPRYPNPCMVGAYRQDDGTLTGLCVTELTAAASLGGALSLVSSREMKAVLNEKKFSAVMVDNLQEVMNICTRLFTPHPTCHVSYQAPVMPVTGPLPADVAALLRNPKVRADYDVTIPNYPPGTVRFLAPIVELELH